MFTKSNHLKKEENSDTKWAGDTMDQKSTSGFYCFIRGNIISWKSKKQQVVVWSNAKVEYRAMAITACEMLWLKQLFLNLNISHKEAMIFCCDSKVVIHITNNPVYQEHTKYIEVDCHFLREQI